MVQQRNDEGQTKATPGRKKREDQAAVRFTHWDNLLPSLQRNRAKANSLGSPSLGYLQSHYIRNSIRETFITLVEEYYKKGERILKLYTILLYFIGPTVINVLISHLNMFSCLLIIFKSHSFLYPNLFYYAEYKKALDFCSFSFFSNDASDFHLWKLR